jgi:hypothetical protein
MVKYNLDKLIKIEYNDFKPSMRYSFKKKKTFLGFVIQKDGVYDAFGFNIELPVIPVNHILKDNTVYEIPEVILYYQGDYSEIYYFNSYDEAKKFADKIEHKINKWHNGLLWQEESAWLLPITIAGMFSA